MKSLKRMFRRVKTRIELDTAVDTITSVFEEHIPDRWRLDEIDDDTLMALSVDKTIKHTWIYTQMSDQMLHCLAHAFCADVLKHEGKDRA